MTMIACLALLSLALLSPAAAEERILFWGCEARIEKDASVLVTENIQVQSEGVSIRRGLLRQLPTKVYFDEKTGQPVSYQLLTAFRDAVPINPIPEVESSLVRYRLSQEGVILAPGTHNFTVQYRTHGSIYPYPDQDMLLLPINGGWPFVIDAMQIEIKLVKPMLPQSVKWRVYALTADPTQSVDARELG